jgi:peptidyl-prolyl cis-trans isomerase A (cyclophilin A)
VEKLAAGFEKQKVVCVTNSFKRETSCSWKTVSVHYEGSLEWKSFDSSYPKKPIEFPLGQGNVIEGWDEGIALLRVGDKARFVPSHLGYGSRGAGGAIPPNATLILT